MLVQLRMRQVTGESPINSPVDGIRILALLPRRWRKDLRQATGDIIIRVQTDEEITDTQIRDQVTDILANPEVSHWELVTCQTLNTGNHDSKEDHI